MKKYLSVICLIFVALSVFLLKQREDAVNSLRESAKNSTIQKYVVVLDAGHGGFDPGKVGVHGEKEKEINLKIAYRLKELLELNDCEVVMTRESDEGLYQASDSNKKSADMRKRVEIIKEKAPDLAVSIHQNSFTQESSKGAQVFYYGRSTEGKQLAEIIQEQMKLTLNDGNHRIAKPNESYYMLKKSTCPLVIVECGFLSNYKESEMLMDEAYQEKLAWSIHLGVMNYLYHKGNETETFETISSLDIK